MNFQVEKFHDLVKQIETRHIEWFQQVEPDDKNSHLIESHYFVYFELKDGHQLRFKPYSNLPEPIRDEIKEIFISLKNESNVNI